MEKTLVKINPTPGNVCVRFGCTICGGSTEKTNVHMTFIDPADGDEEFVCEYCVEGGPEAIKEALLRRADHLRGYAEELSRLAEASFVLPSYEEIDRAYYENARGHGYKGSFTDFMAESGYEAYAKVRYRRQT